MGFVFFCCCHLRRKVKRVIFSLEASVRERNICPFFGFLFQFALTCTSRNFSNSWDDMLVFWPDISSYSSSISVIKHKTLFSWVLYFYLYFSHSSITMIKWLFPMKLCIYQDEYTLTGDTHGECDMNQTVSTCLPICLTKTFFQFLSKHEICSKFLRN